MYASTDDVEAMGATKAIADAITQMWYNGEVNLYPQYGSNDLDMTHFESWGHFSQLVWMGSEKIGCAAQYCPPGTMMDNMGSWFTVCDYYPQGKLSDSAEVQLREDMADYGVLLRQHRRPVCNTSQG